MTATNYGKTNTVSKHTPASNKSVNTVKKEVIPVKVQKTEQQIALENMVAAQLTDRRFAPVSYEELSKRVTYVTASNGLFKVTKTPIGLFKEMLAEITNPIPGVSPMEAGVDLIIPKIPMRKLVEALSWYRDINDADKTEASTLFFWNHNDINLPNLPGLSSEGQLVTYCPIQKNSGALSDFTMDENVKWFRENLALLLEVHSH